MIITDKLVLGIGIAVVYIILSVLIFTNIISSDYLLVAMGLAGTLLGGCYQAFVPDITIFKFGADNRTVRFNSNVDVREFDKDPRDPIVRDPIVRDPSISDLSMYKPLELQKCNFPQPPTTTFPEPTITGAFTSIQDQIDDVMKTQVVPTDRSDIKRIINVRSIFKIQGSNDINSNQLALMLIGDYYLIDNLSKYVTRTNELIPRSLQYKLADYVKLAINNYELANSNSDKVNTLVENLAQMKIQIDNFINKNQPPTSIDIHALIKLLVANLPPNDKRILISAGMAYACDATGDRYQAKRYSNIQTSNYSVARYASIVIDILNGVI